MDSEAEPPTKTLKSRHKCSACFKQFNKKEHLVEHMRASYHSVHQPKCGVCQKYCKTFESVREHLNGPLSKANCYRIFVEQGCSLCMKIFDSPATLSEHKKMCRLPAPPSLGPLMMPGMGSRVDKSAPDNRDHSRGLDAVAIDCEMVGGGSDGSLDLCARVCLVDKNENLIFHTYVQPQIPVTNYRYEVTGITEEHLRDAMPLNEVEERLLEILCNGESIGKLWLDGGGKARLLVGHDLEHDLSCLGMNYPDNLLRDTAKYLPLMKTNMVSHSLKYLTWTYLGYDIQSGVHDPFVDCVSAMRLYKRMCAQDHQVDMLRTSILALCTENVIANAFDSWNPEELESKTPDELFHISKLDYRCWCLDSMQD